MPTPPLHATEVCLGFPTILRRFLSLPVPFQERRNARILLCRVPSPCPMDPALAGDAPHAAWLSPVGRH